jgi:hypothetical protein
LTAAVADFSIVVVGEATIHHPSPQVNRAERRTTLKSQSARNLWPTSIVVLAMQKDGGQKDGGQKDGGQKDGGQKDGGQKDDDPISFCKTVLGARNNDQDRIH